MNSLSRIFWQKFISFVLVFSTLFSIGSPVVYAKGFFSFLDTKKEKSAELPAISREKLVAVLVEDELLRDNNLKNKISRYANDVQEELQARVILMPVPREASPREIQEGLAQFYFSGDKNDSKSQLIGTVLIGDVPIPVVDKNGGLNPAIFPYVDFENVNYKWNYETERFQWVGGDNEPEIWHGLIRSDADSTDSRIAELKKYFENNHQVHKKNISYPKKVFFTELERQRKGISDKQKEFYENWINHLGDFMYLRFNKHWLKELLDKQIVDIPKELLPPESQNQDQTADFSQMPDIFAKNPIETMSMQYLSANKNLLSQINEQVESAGRWTSRDIDTTISLISKKDEWAANVLKSATDEVENIFITKSRENNVAENVSIISNSGAVPSLPLPPLKYLPTYWLGIPKNNLKEWNWRTGDTSTPPEYPAENCSLYRGTVRTEDNSIAQKVEISRVFNPYLFDNNPDDRCMGKAGGSGVSFADCRLPNYIADMNTGIFGSVFPWEEVDNSVFSYTGSREIFETNYDGASGCAPIIRELQSPAVQAVTSAGEVFSSLMIHNEPTVETIKAMVNNTTANAIPIDPHHGISFYDHSFNFHRINFPSAFDLINKRDELDSSFELLTKAELEQVLVTAINQINQTNGNTGAISETFFADSYWMNPTKQKELIKAIKWLGTDLEQKNVSMLTGAISSTSRGRDVLGQNDYDGYELMEIRGKLSNIKPNGGIKVAFERGEENPTTTFIDAQNKEFSLENTDVNSNSEESSSNSQLQAEFEKIFAENESKSDECGANLLTWPTACLIPWIKELPNVLGNITKLESNLDLEKEEEVSAKTRGNNDKSSFSLSSTKPETESSFTQVTAETSNLNIANDEGTPIDITVYLKDENGEILTNDYKTEIEIIPMSSDAGNFFSVLPATKIIAKKGQATFHLLPQKKPFGGEASFKFRGNLIESDVVSIKISANKIEAFADDDKVNAGDTIGTNISAKILDKEGRINHSFDGKILSFSSKQGKFYSEDFTASRAKIKNGIAQIIFLPGIKSGEATISIKDDDKILPVEKVYLEIIPETPSAIDLIKSPETLVKNGKSSSYFAGISDKYGNVISELTNKIKWETKGDLLLDKTENNSALIRYKKNEPSLLKNVVKEVIGEKKNEVLLSAEILDEKGNVLKLAKSREILLTELPSFEVSIPSDSQFIAGDQKPLEINIQAKKSNGEVLKNSFTAQVLIDNPLVGSSSPKVSFVDGKANLEIFAGNTSGNINVQILSPGFVTNTFSLEVKPAEAHHIKLLANNTDLNADATNPLDLKVEVLDKYGNIANFNGEVVFDINPSESFENTAQDIKDLGIFSNDNLADSFVDGQQQTSNNEDIVETVSLEHETMTIVSGKGNNKISPRGIAGKAYILATANGLLSGTIEIDVAKVLAKSDFQVLSPKSLLTLLLGFAGGNLNEESIGNRFIFDGRTQAVATQISPASKPKVLGNIFADAAFSQELQPQIIAGNKFKILLNNIATATINYAKEPEFFVGKKDTKAEGIYFQPAEGLSINDFNLKSREISYQDKKLFVVSKNGGVLLKNSLLSFKNIKNSLFEWEIYLEGDLLGNLYLNLDKAKVMISDDLNNLVENSENKIIIEPLNEKIEVSSFLNGKTTTAEKGVIITSKTEKEDQSRMLGSANFDAKNKNLGWSTEWKGGTLFAANNAIGNSTKWGSGDSFILLGDPTLSLSSKNEKSELNLTKDLGKPIWKSSLGVIDDIITGDINYDNKSEIFIRTGDDLTALYQDTNNTDNFRDIGKILRFGDGAKKVVSYNKNNGDLKYIIQINDKGKLIFHHNINGKFFREKIDLGINNPIENIEVADFNSDEFKDLILLDNSNNLYFVYGHANGFYSAQKLDSLAANFTNISEKYLTTDGQNLDEKVFNPDKFKNLDNFFAGFSGVENYSWAENLKKIGDINFMPVTKNKAFDIRFEMEIDNPNNVDESDLKVENDTKFTQKLFIYPKETDLNNFQLIVPNFAGFEADFKSFSAINCGGETPEITQKENSFLITNCNISKNSLAKFSWNLKVKEIPLINFMVEDFEGNDGIDDVVIPWEENGKKKFIQYLSSGNLKMYPPNPAKKTIDSPESPIVKTHLKKIVDAFPEGTTFPIDDFDDQQSAQDMLECLKNSDNGLPELYQSPSVDDVLSNISASINFAGLQIPSIAFLAPGPQSIYIPPFSFPGPQSPGFPTLWVGPSPPFVGFGPNPSSLFRLYIMPTTTLRLGIGICGGPVIDPSMTATGIPFPPQCFVIVPPLSTSSSGGGNGSGDNNGNGNNNNKCSFQNPANSSGINISKNNFLLNSFVNTGSAFNLGDFQLTVGSYSKNLQIASPDIITEWVKAQLKEFSNYKFPRFDIVLPEFPKSKNNKNLKPLDKLSQSPYFEIKKEKLEINYPSFSQENLAKYDKNFGLWKKGNLNIKKSLKLKLLDLDNYNFAEFESAIENYRLKINNKLSVEVALPDLSKLPLDLQNSINTEALNSKNNANNLKQLVNQKLDSLKNIPDELVNSAKNKIQEQLDELEKIESLMEGNLQALKSYKEEVGKLKKVPQKIKKTTKELANVNEVIKTYWSTWLEKNKKAAQEWKNFEKKTTATIKTWNEIPRIFKDFTTSCTAGGGGGGTSVNRGTMLTWLSKILLSAIKLPVIPMPQFPDTKIDLSKVKIGASLTIPDISFQPVKVSLPNLPSLKVDIDIASQLEGSLQGSLQGVISQIGAVPNLTLASLTGITNSSDILLAGQGINTNLQSYNASLSASTDSINVMNIDFAGNFIDNFPTIKLPNIPKLPVISVVVPEIKVPTINLPQLPTLLPPPKFPNLLKPITTIISVFKPIVKNILCNLSLGIIPIPEWKVASRVVQLTNRTGLLPMDFVLSAQLPSIPKITLPPIEISPEISLTPAFDSLNIQIKAMAQTMNNLTNMMSAMGKGLIPPINNISPTGVPFSSISPHKNSGKLAEISIYDETKNSGEIDNTKVVAKIRGILNSKSKNINYFTQTKPKSNLEKKLALYKGLRAENGFISSSDTPKYLPTGFDSSSYDSANQEPVPTDKLYYFSLVNNKAESITSFPINGQIHQLEIADLDEDGQEEILYSLGGQLFMKRPYEKTLTEAEEDLKYKNPDEVTWQDFAEFKQYFSPVIEYDSLTNSTESELEFLPPKSREISYFEWIISDSPDRLFEKNINSNQKISEEWKRIGFLIRPKGHKYQIRKGIAEIQKVRGNPILYGNFLQEIKKTAKSDCNNSEVIKPFFPRETILVGVDKESQFQVRTKQRAGQQEDTRNIILRSGEETVVDFAEICLTRGKINYIDLEKTEKFTPKSGDHFFSNMRLELGKNDEVELSLFNGTNVHIYGGEKYELYSFNSREKYIGHIKNLDLGNHYGQLSAFTSAGKSFTYSKDLLHDPQLSDDDISPEIIISQGNKIEAFITKDINIDTSQSYDNQKISRVWWERDGKIILDSNSEKYSIIQSLKIKLPSVNSPQKFSITLNIEDESGNISRQEIPIEVKVPNLKLSDVSQRDQQIIGKTEEGIVGLKVGFLRERNGRKDILEKVTLTDSNGEFKANKLGTSGNIFLKDKNTNKNLVEILPTGRPVIFDKKKATLKINTKPLAIQITDSKQLELATINFKTNSNNDVELDSQVNEISAKKADNLNSVYITDANQEDSFIWKSFSGGFSLLDTVNNKTLGTITNNGQFTSTDYFETQDLKIRPKKTEEENSPIIFQIYSDKDKRIIAEFFIPVKNVIVQ